MNLLLAKEMFCRLLGSFVIFLILKIQTDESTVRTRPLQIDTRLPPWQVLILCSGKKKNKKKTNISSTNEELRDPDKFLKTKTKNLMAFLLHLMDAFMLTADLCFELICFLEFFFLRIIKKGKVVESIAVHVYMRLFSVSASMW